MNRISVGALGAELAVPGGPQPDAVAEIIQRVRPDVLLINEFDFDPQALVDFQANYLSVAHGDAEPIEYRSSIIAPFRLSSKSHWDLPIDVDGWTVHFLVSHPTPPVFDDPPAFPAGVDFNGRRNRDEIRFWADYVHPGRSGYIYDDDGVYGGLDGDDRFVIAGDQNSDPLDGDSIPPLFSLVGASDHRLEWVDVRVG